MKKYIRSERANLFEPNVYISMVVKISGNVSREAVRQAVLNAYEANEATMSMIVLEDSGDAYYKRMESSGCKFFYDERRWQSILNESEKNPFAINEGELVRTFMTEEEGQTVLLVHAHHLVGDGKSILVLIKDIVNSLDNKELSYKSMFLVDREYLEKKARLSWGIKFITEKVNGRWKRVRKSFDWEDYYRIHTNYWENHFSEIEIKSYDVRKLKQQCTNGVTLNSYMITDLLREHPESKVVGIPVNIREDDEGMSNQTSGIVIKQQYITSASFEENVIKIHKEIYKKIKNRNMKYFILLYMERLCPTLVDAVLLQTHGCYHNKLSEKMALIMGYMGDDGRDLGVTNLTRIDIPCEYKEFKIEDILFIPPKVSYAKNVAGIATYGNKLTVTYHKMVKNSTE